MNLLRKMEVEISKGKKAAQCRLSLGSTQRLLSYREQSPITAEPLICELLRADESQHWQRWFTWVKEGQEIPVASNRFGI